MSDMTPPGRELELASFLTDSIIVDQRARSLNTKRVEALMESIQAIGLRSPITVLQMSAPLVA